MEKEFKQKINNNWNKKNEKKLKTFGYKNDLKDIFCNDDREKEVIEIIDKNFNNHILLRGSKGCGKTYVALKYALYNGYKIKEVNLFEMKISLDSKKEIHKNLNFMDSINYSLFNSKNIFLSFNFWFSSMSLLLTLLSAIIMFFELNFDLWWLPISFLIFPIIFFIYVFILVLFWFKNKNKKIISHKNNSSKAKCTVIIFTENNLNSFESFEILYMMYQFYNTKKNNILIFESTSDDKEFLKNVEKLELKTIEIKSNYDLNRSLCNEFVTEDIKACSDYKNTTNEWIFDSIDKYYNHLQKLEEPRKDFFFSEFDHDIRKKLDIIYQNISNRNMQAIIEEYKQSDKLKKLNFIDYLIIQIAKKEDLNFLNGFISGKLGIFDKTISNEYIIWTEKQETIQSKQFSFDFKYGIEWWKEILILRLYFEVNSNKFKKKHTNIPFEIFVRSKTILTYENLSDYIS